MGASRIKACLIGVLMRPNRCLVRNRQVIAFHEVFRQALPVGVPDMVFSKDGDVIFLRVIRHDRGQISQRICDRLGVRVQ